jgi:hypothetical protein
VCFEPGLPDFSRYDKPRRGKNDQNGHELFFCVANTFQIQPFHKGLAKQTDVAFLCREHSTDNGHKIYQMTVKYTK